MLSLSAFVDKIYELDFALLDLIADNLRCGFLDLIMPIITFLGDGGWFWIACAVIMLFFKKTRKTGLMMGLALICGLVLCNLTLKPLVARIRPYDLRPIENMLTEPMHDFSFPSGHTIASFEAAIVLLIRDKRFGIPATVLASVIAFSRLYLYVHYPTDVLASVILGSLLAVFSVWAVNKLYARFEK
ncbi:MAG: phosphatase PAP2 family protein [Clostridia bacterium]|nr:phosphatase PAP2 family protein [Clostridia bacterium]